MRKIQVKHTPESLFKTLAIIDRKLKVEPRGGELGYARGDSSSVEEDAAQLRQWIEDEDACPTSNPDIKKIQRDAKTRARADDQVDDGIASVASTAGVGAVAARRKAAMQRKNRVIG